MARGLELRVTMMPQQLAASQRVARLRAAHLREAEDRNGAIRPPELPPRPGGISPPPPDRKGRPRLGSDDGGCRTRSLGGEGCSPQSASIFACLVARLAGWQAGICPLAGGDLSAPT